MEGILPELGKGYVDRNKSAPLECQPLTDRYDPGNDSIASDLEELRVTMQV